MSRPFRISGRDLLNLKFVIHEGEPNMADCFPICTLNDLLLLSLIAIFGTVQKLLEFLNEKIMCLQEHKSH